MIGKFFGLAVAHHRAILEPRKVVYKSRVNTYQICTIATQTVGRGPENAEINGGLVIFFAERSRTVAHLAPQSVSY